MSYPRSETPQKRLTSGALFGKDTLSFFSKDDNSFNESNGSLEESLEEPLDIVGALSTLNLDEELALKNEKSHLGASMTPNPPSVGAFSATPNTLAHQGSTPLTWGNNFVPFSAPPLTYSTDSLMALEMAMQIAPFQLPDENPSDRMGFHENRTSTPPIHSFGGILDSQFGQYMPEFELPQFMDSEKKERVPNVFSSPISLNVWNRNQNASNFEYRDNRDFQYNRNHQRRQNYMNNGVNIHRKMHSSHKRKGDDAAKYANAKLEDFSGEIYSLCKDQHGCRFLQRQLDLEKESDKKSGVVATMIFNEIYLKIVELMADPFGNYLIQKLFENVSADQRLILVKNAAPDFISIALDPHGTRALQKLVECISTREESDLVIESLSPHIVSLSRDLNGNHVVQKCLQKLKPETNQFIFDAASRHCAEIAMHRHGCCVLQRCLDHGDALQRKQLSMRVAEVATILALDPFGNYVVQYVLSRGDETSIGFILDHILANIIQLSLHKFGSNVIEKSLRIGKLTDSVIEVLLKNSRQFSLLLNDPFGNYVLQTSLDVASDEDLQKLAAALQPYLANIKNTPHGRRILTKIQNII